MKHRIGERRWHRRYGAADARRSRLRWAAWSFLLGLVTVGVPQGAFAAGVVGTGTPESCTEAALDAALSVFSCWKVFVRNSSASS